MSTPRLARVGLAALPSFCAMCRAAVCPCVVLLVSACASIGPATVERDRFDYVTSISESWKRQMLLNLLKVRYVDAPVFLDVATVISSYELQGNVALTAQAAPANRSGDTFLNLGAAGHYVDRPTITYSVLTGDKFAKSILSPIPITGILLVVQGGTPVDLVLRFCVNKINGLENSYGGRPTRAGDPRFAELLAILRADQIAGGAELQFKSGAEIPQIVLYLRPPHDEAMALRHRRIAELLGLNQMAHEYSVVFGTFPSKDTEIAMQSRSMMQVLTDIASYFDPPATDSADGRVQVPRRTAEQLQLFPPLISVRHSDEKPPSQDAYAAVRYRDRWFWVDDRDDWSKTVINATMLLFSLTETGPQAGAIVTIPTR